MKAKISIIISFIFLLSFQVYSNIQQYYSKKDALLLEENLASHQLSFFLAEKEGQKKDIEFHSKNLEELCREISNSTSYPSKLRRRAKRIIADTMYKTGRENEALDYCNSLLKEREEDKEILKIKAHIFWKEGQNLSSEKKYDEAIGKYKEILSWDITPSLNAFYKSLIAQLYRQKKEYDKAIEWYERIIKEHPRQLDWSACSSYFIAEIFNKKGKEEAAKNWYLHIIQDYSQSEWAKMADKRLSYLESQSQCGQGGKR